MYKLILTALFSFTLLLGFGQLDKGVWLVGGNAGLLAGKNETQANERISKANILNISVNPNVGYFIADKLAVGSENFLHQRMGSIDGIHHHNHC